MAREIRLARREEITYVTPRDFASAVFNHRRLVVWTFLLVLAAAFFYLLLRQPLYRSQMTILINLERTNPVVTTDPNMVQRTVPGITAEEINSEMELLKTRDLLQEVVMVRRLYLPNGSSWWGRYKSWLGKIAGTTETPQNIKVARAVSKLQSDLAVELIPKSTLIRVSYSSADPELSAKVLETLSDLYLKKHLAVRRPPGTFDFFKEEADRYHRKLEEAERSLENFPRDNHVASVIAEKEATLKKLTELQVARHETEAAIGVTSQRIETLQLRMAQVPSRLTTQVRRASSLPPDQLQSTLLTLELKHTELEGLFQPDYPAVTEVEKQIADAKAALAASQKQAVVEKTTDRDPTYEWMRGELEKARVDLVDLRSREKATTAMIGRFAEKATRLNDLEVRQNELARSAKLAEEAYINYQQKEEEARISDALDRQRILNVAIAEKPSIPILPSTLPSSIVLLIGLVMAGLASVGLAFSAEQMNASFRTRQEVENYLEIPLVAAIPERFE